MAALKKKSKIRNLKKSSRISKNFIPKGKKIKGRKKVTEFENLSIINPIKNFTEQVQRILPHWLNHPKIIRSDILKNRKELSYFTDMLGIELMSTLQKRYEYLFPVQYSVVNYILSDDHGMESRYRPRDVCVAAPTGSGKTLAYVLPIIKVLSKRHLVAIRALIILPVTELAEQVAEEVKHYAKVFNLKVGLIYGNGSISGEQNVMVEKSINGWKTKVDIIVCTPDRLAIHMSQTVGLDFSQLRYLVLDEADHLLKGDGNDLFSQILKRISSDQKTLSNVLPPNVLPYNVNGMDGLHYAYPPAPAQKLLFSATLSHNPQQLRVAELHSPVLFATSGSDDDLNPVITEGRTGRFVRPSNLVEEYTIVKANSKVLALYRILRKESQSEQLRALVFANSVKNVLRLSKSLRQMCGNEFNVDCFSTPSKKRRTILNDFKSGKINVLIATDAMARGINVDNITCVISYEIVDSNTYTHRSGRTARAGKTGKSISIVCRNEVWILQKTLGRSFSKATKIILSGCGECLEELKSPHVNTPEKDKTESDSE